MTAATASSDRAADLHLHTCYSDGTFTPAELVRAAQACGLSAIAVTDHDTLESFGEAQATARELSVELIPGIELSTQTATDDIHLLGYYPDLDDSDFLAWLQTLKTDRLRRLETMVERLRRLGVAISVEDVLRVAGPGTVGRLHVARTLVQRGAVSETNEAFDKYLGTHKPAYVEGCHPRPEEALRRLRAAGAVPVLAHPAYLADEAIIPVLVQHGLAGIEVYHSGHDVSAQQRYRRLADEHQLLMTGGSDCHGLAKGQILVGSVKLPYTYVEQLKAWHAQTRTG